MPLICPSRSTSPQGGDVARNNGGPTGQYVPPDSAPMCFDRNQSGPATLQDPLAGKGYISGVWHEVRTTHLHEGVDLAAPRGTPVLSADPGVVTHAGWGYGGYGQYVDIEDFSFAVRFRYAHLDAIVSGVTSGARVDTGQLIGFVGNTGTKGFHLHFEIFSGRQTVDPLRFLPGRSL